MISFWVTAADSHGIETYRLNRGRAIADRFRIQIYDRVSQGIRLSHGPQIFAALDKITDAQRQVVAMIWDAHERIVPSATRLNDPRRVLRRFDLLDTLHRAGINRFRVWRATDVDNVNRFPVFIRIESDHAGPRTGLLTTRREVVKALRALRLRGRRLTDLMIVEFCDTAGSDGRHWKYAAFKVGNAIIPCHAMVSRQWSVKSDHNSPDEVTIREELHFIESNPHETWLRRVFEVAGIDYGRVDYGVVDGVPQVWEINLNPTIGRGPGERRHHSLPQELRALRDGGREAFHDRLRRAFLEMDTSRDECDSTVPIDQALLSRLEADAARARRRQRVLTWLHAVYGHPTIGMPARLAYLKLFPRQ